MALQADLWGELPPKSAAMDRVPSIDDVPASWKSVAEPFFAGVHGLALQSFLLQRLCAGSVVYPPQPFRMLQLTPLDAVRVVIVGQDPYHGPGQAEGLAFSVASGVKTPPSLRNIHKEVWRSLGEGPMPSDANSTCGSLVPWARQGVLLINSCLTVEDGLPASHAKQGWEILTKAILEACIKQQRRLVFMLWGAHAQQLLSAVRGSDRHLVLRSNHPSPLAASRGPDPFIGNGHFVRANQWLMESTGHSINWLEIFQKTVA